MSVCNISADRIRRRSPAGFGLIELMVTIAIVAILTAIALPSYQQSIKLNRVATDTNDFLSAINTARSEAVSRGRPITVCASTNGTACDGTGTADWSNGWIVFTDYGTTGVVEAGAPSSDAVLRVWGKVHTRDTLTSVGGGIGYISFGRTGSAKFGNGANSAEFTLKPQDCSAQLQRSIKISTLGRSASAPEDCS